MAILLAPLVLGRPKRGKLLSSIFLALMAGGCLLQVACTNASMSSNGNVRSAAGGTPAGTYTIQVIGTAGSTQHSTTLTLTVQ